MITTNNITWSEIKGQIRLSHCLVAMQQIDKMGVPNKRDWKKYYIHFKRADGSYKDYPPKLVIELAFNIAARQADSYLKITSNDFSENKYLKEFLESLGFSVFEIVKK